MKLTADYLRARLDYDPETGVFRWKAISEIGNANVLWNARWAGRVAGHLNSTGYCTINLGRRHYQASRLAWLYVHGRWPEGEIDHVDHNPSNNRMSNLRDASHEQNLRNLKRVNARNKSGVRGVSWCRATQRWRASICLDGKPKNLGRFDTVAEAAEAYAIAAYDAYGEFANVLDWPEFPFK